MAISLGLNAKAYFGTAGSTASTVIDNIRDITLNLTKAEADVTTRGANGWTLTVGTLKDGTVDANIIWDDADAFFTAVQTAYFNDTPIAMLFLDKTGGQGLDADFSIVNFTRNEALAEALTADVSFKPTYSTRYPEWVEGS